MPKSRKTEPGHLLSKEKERSIASELEEEKRELEAAEIIKESKQEIIERKIEKRFILQQPPRKRTNRRGL